MSALRSVLRVGRLLGGVARVPARLPALFSITPIQLPQFHQHCFMSQDSALASALSDEIQHEDGAAPDLTTDLPDSIGGFQYRVIGAKIILFKEMHDEQIKIELDLNNITELTPSEEDPEETPPQYLPSFIIDISKPRGKLLFKCNYHMSTEEQYVANVDQYVISEVAFVRPGQADDDAFTTDFGNLDLVLIREFENYLQRRGIDAEFSSALFEMSSALEHSNYVQFLKNVRDFV